MPASPSTPNRVKCPGILLSDARNNLPSAHRGRGYTVSEAAAGAWGTMKVAGKPA